MVVAGGLDESLTTSHRSVSVIQNDGSECLDHIFPDLPKPLKDFGMVAINDQVIILCGGTNTESE